jgi:hypothetical protein
VTFPLTQQNLQYWNSSSNAFATSTGNYGIEVGDSNANLPLSGTLAVTSAELGQPVTITNPGPQEGLAGTAASVAGQRQGLDQRADPVLLGDRPSGGRLDLLEHRHPQRNARPPRAPAR